MGQKGCCRVEGRQLSEHVTLGVLTKAVPVTVVDEVLQQTGRQNWRARHLLPRVMVYYVMALTLYAHASYDAVLRELVEGLRWLRWEGAALDLVCKSAITQARVRLGEAPLRELFRRLARPLAEPGAPGAWYQGRRLVSFDGTTIDDTAGESFELNASAAQKAGTLAGTVRVISLDQGSMPGK
jgi:hypothetical protein